MTRHRDELPYPMQEAGDELGLFHEDGTLKSFSDLIAEAVEIREASPTQKLIRKAEKFVTKARWCGGHGDPGFPSSESLDMIRELVAHLEKIESNEDN